MSRVTVFVAAVKLGIDWRVGVVVSGDSVDTTAGAGREARVGSAESAAAIGPLVTPIRFAAPGLLFSGVRADSPEPGSTPVGVDRSLSAAVPWLLCLPNAVADVAAALFEVCLLVNEPLDVGDE